MVKWACRKICAMPMSILVILTSRVIVHGFPTTAEGPFNPVTAPLDPRLDPVATDLPESDPSFKKTDAEFQPEQISVSLSYNYDSVWISWVTGEFQIGEGVVPLDPTSVQSVVQYRESNGVEDEYATGDSLVYGQRYDSEGLNNYTSGIIHHVQLTGLKPKTLYRYQCGDPSLSAMSAVYYFRTMPKSTTEDYPSRIAVAGNLGLTYNSSETWGHMLPNHPDLVLLIGGFSYADTYLTNGTKLGCDTCHHTRNETNSESWYGQETYQPRWDYWGRFMEPLTANVPTMLAAGENEVEPQADNQTFVAYSSRFIFPSDESCSFTALYYSFNAGGIHFIILNAYTRYDNSSDQYKWLENDLQKVNRSETPWLVAAWSAPWYSTFKERYREAECMRIQLEELLNSYRVDIVFNGEVNAYERSNRVYNYTLDPCGPVYVAVGAGGCGKLEVDHADDSGNCSVPSESCTGRVCNYGFTPWPANGTTSPCPDTQPDYSAYRESSLGFGMLEVKNETHALWSWKRNQDRFLLAGDIIYIVRQPELCPVPT